MKRTKHFACFCPSNRQMITVDKNNENDEILFDHFVVTWCFSYMVIVCDLFFLWIWIWQCYIHLNKLTIFFSFLPLSLIFVDVCESLAEREKVVFLVGMLTELQLFLSFQSVESEEGWSQPTFGDRRPSPAQRVQQMLLLNKKLKMNLQLLHASQQEYTTLTHRVTTPS